MLKHEFSCITVKLKMFYLRLIPHEEDPYNPYICTLQALIYSYIPLFTYKTY